MSGIEQTAPEPGALVYGLRKVTVALRQLPGAILLLEPLRRSFGRSQAVARVHDFQGGLTMDLRLADHMASQIFWYGTYCRDIIAILKSLLVPGMTVIDIGANIGEISLAAAQLVGSSGHVLSFEPSEETANWLARHVALNALEQIEQFRIGLSDFEGEVPLYSAKSSFDDGTDHQSGLSTLYPSAARQDEIGRIRLSTLDTVLGSRTSGVHLIKIDIEGAELPALKGAARTLEQSRPWLIIEVQDETCRAAGYAAADILEHLAGFGYSAFHIGRHGHLTPITAQTLHVFQNILFVPPGGRPKAP